MTLTREQQAVADRNSAELARHWQQVADHQREIIHQAHALLDSAGVPRVQPNPTNANDLIQRLQLLVEHDREGWSDLQGAKERLMELTRQGETANEQIKLLTAYLRGEIDHA